VIVHICEEAAWREAQAVGKYCPLSLEVEGFIHASLPEQVLRAANRFYAGQDGLVVIWIDPQHTQPPIRYEPADGELFPHIYGPLNLDAVQAVCRFPSEPDGVFRRLPPAGSESLELDSLS
jgi:uncharacterized protein (DUF952 family)